MTIKVGLIGFGLSGRFFHGPFIQNDAEMALTCVCTRQEQAVQETHPQARVVSGVDEVMTAQDVDLVVITTPNSLHFEQAKQALENGKHVLLEKPSVTTVEQIEELCTLSKQKGLVFCVYQNRRFDGDFQHLKALIESKELGELKQLESRFDRFRPQLQDRWGEQPGVGAGIFWNLGPHLFDQILLLFGTPDWLQASIDILRDGGQTADTFELELGYGEKRIRLGYSTFEAGEASRFNARFTHGRWQCFGVDPQEEALRSGQMPGQDAFPSAGRAQSMTHHKSADQLTVESKEGIAPIGQYVDFYQQLRDAILHQGEPPVSLVHASQLVYGLCLAEESAAKNQRLTWDYQPNI